MIYQNEHFGRLLRRLRESRGLSLRDLASLSQISKTKLNSLEGSDGRSVDDADAARLDEVLDSGLALQTAAIHARTAALPAVARGLLRGPNRFTDLAVRLLGSEIEPQGVDPVYRRTFLQGAGAGFAAPVLALEAARHGLGVAMSERMDNSVEDWAEIVEEHGYGYMSMPPYQLIDSLMVDVVAIQYAIPDAQERGAEQDLQRSGALLAALAAMTLANLGMIAESRRWWRTSRHLAEKSQDLKVLTWIRGREVVRALYEQRPIGIILRMVDSFEGSVTNAPEEAIPEFLSGKAQALALAGRATEASACLPHLEDVYASLPSSITADGSTIFAWSADRLRFTQSYVHSFNGNFTEADKAQREAVKLYPNNYARGPAQIELQRALCLSKMGDAAEAARHARAILGALPAVDYIQPIVDLGHRVLHTIPAADNSLPEVVAFRELLTGPRQIEA